jgi:hemolysin III
MSAELRPAGLRRVSAVVPLPLSVIGDPLDGSHKPAHRGRLHQWSAPLAGVVGVALVANALPGRKIASAVYALSLVGLLCTSALYNRTVATKAFRVWMRWLDHSMIYVLIAGSYTPIGLHVLPRAWGVPLVIGVWIGAIAGVAFKISPLRVHRRVAGTLYVVLASAYLLAIPKLLTTLSTGALVGMHVGNAAYAIGAIGLWLRRPNPSKDFGYHEVWHVWVLIGAAGHFVMTWLSVVG